MSQAGGAIFAVVSAKGGVGKSVFSPNFALALLREMKKRVLLVDLDLGGAGSAALALGEANPKRALSDLAPLLASLNPGLLKGYLGPHPSGLTLLGAYHSLEEAAALTPEVIGRLLDILAQAYDLLVVDLGTGFNLETLACLERASGIFMLFTPDLLSINQTQRGLEILQRMAFPRQMIHLVLNRQQAKSGMSEEVVERKLQRELFGVVPEDQAYFQAALNEGQPAILRDPRHPVSRALDDMAARIWALDLTRPELKLKPVAGALRAAAPPGVMAAAAPASGIAAAPEAAAGQPPPQGQAPRQEQDPVDRIKLRIHERLLEEMDLKQVAELDGAHDPEKLKKLRADTKKLVDRLVDEEAEEIADRARRGRLSTEVLNEALGLGPLEDLLADETVTEIMVNGPAHIFVERKGKITESGLRFLTEKHLRGAIERIVAPLGRRIDELSPMVDARLRDGSRVNAVIPPLAVDGALLTIRKFSKKPLAVADLVRLGSMNEQIAELFKCCVQARLNILISGGTGSGKTTLLNMLSSFISHDERIVTIEDSAELQLPQPHVCRLESRPPSLEGSGEVTIRDLVRNALRMRPDRIVVGECRGAEALDMLQAMNTGHDGSLTTIHANTPRDSLNRLETLVMFAGLDLPSRAIREQVVAAVDLIIQQSRMPDGSRKIVHIAEVTGMEADVITLQDIFMYKQTGLDAEGRVQGKFVSSGFIPSFMSALEEKGFKVPRDIFLESYE